MPGVNKTNLVRLSTGFLEKYAIDSTPPYIAVSHTWVDRLFDPKSPFRETTGGQAIINLVVAHQASETNKRRQIPLMGSIYSKAVSVAVTLPYGLKMTQEDVDKLVQALDPAFKMVEEDKWSFKNTGWCKKEPGKSLITRALYGVSCFIEGSWGTRVWTAQEFLLAKSVIWIGTDELPISIQDSHFYAIVRVLNELFSVEQYERVQRLNHRIRDLLLSRLQNIDRTRFMTIISLRHCSVPQDMIYGGMAASGVQIDVVQTERVEDIWRLWWEQAIKQQHVRWACCAIIWKTSGVPLMLPDYNCAMPAFRTRQVASDVLNMNRVEPLGPMELNSGTVSFYGWDVGDCKIVAHLGHYHSIERDGRWLRYQDLTFILWSRGSFQLAFRIATAFSHGHFKIRNLLLVAQVLSFNYWKAIWAVQNHRQDFFQPIFRSDEQHRIYTHFGSIQGHHRSSVAGTGLEVYLASISNTITITDVAVLMPGKAPEGNLRALDFNASDGSDEFDGRYLTIVKTPDISAPPNSRYPPENETLHKVGVTLPVKFFFLQVYGQHDFEGGEPQLFHIGGASCTLCRTEKTERAPDTLTSNIGLYTGPDPPCMPNIQIKPRVRASPFDPKKTKRPIAMVIEKHILKYNCRILWYKHGHTALPQYPRPLRRRPKVEVPVEEAYNNYLKAKLRPTEGNKKSPLTLTAADLRVRLKQLSKKDKDPEKVACVTSVKRSKIGYSGCLIL
ncbi:MAG: hypothetical protein M1830_009948 [Pleopsidium flavum]|nr:MAG: hypothetical protein M1830_009948 [Pleopsidium flavum]